MPTYEYRFNDTGEVVERFHRMSEILTEIDGRSVTKLISGGAEISMGELGHMDKYPYVSSGLPRNLSGAKHDSKGKPIVMSRKHERELSAMHGLEKE